MGADCNSCELNIDRGTISTVADVKEKVFAEFGIPHNQQKAVFAGKILDDSFDLKKTQPHILNLIVKAPAQKKPQTPEGLLIKDMIKYLRNEKGQSDLLPKFFTFFEGRLQIYSEQFGKGSVYTPLPKNTYIKLIQEIESGADEETSLACDFLFNVLQCTDRSFHPLALLQIYQDRMLFSEKSARTLEHLNRSVAFQSLLEPEMRRKLGGTLSRESYADIRSAKAKAPNLRLFCISFSEVIPLLKQALADQEQFTPGKPIRFQWIVDQGHSTCLDLRINGSERSCVILDTVEEVLDREMKIMMQELGFTVYQVITTIPNKNAYQIRIAPSIGSLEPAIERLHQLDFYKSEEVWHFRDEDKTVKIHDSSLIEKLETRSLSLEELLQTDLDFPFYTLHMQKDMTSCAHFALHHAIRAGKTPHLHELCSELTPLLETDRLLQRQSKNGMIPIRWHDLPSGFIKWSQSATFSDSNIGRSIEEAMNEKIAKRGKQQALPETPAQRMRRLILENQ